LLLLLLAVGGWPISQPPRAEAFSRPSAQPVSTQRCVRVCVYWHKAEVSAYACAYACVASSLCPVYFSSPATLRLPSTTLPITFQPTHIGRGVSRPVKSRSYRHSGRTDSTHRCCYEFYQRSQFYRGLCRTLWPARDWLPGSVHSPPARSPVPTTPMWVRLTTAASQLASRSLGYRE